MNKRTSTLSKSFTVNASLLTLPKRSTSNALVARIKLRAVSSGNVLSRALKKAWVWNGGLLYVGERELTSREYVAGRPGLPESSLGDDADEDEGSARATATAVFGSEMVCVSRQYAMVAVVERRTFGRDSLGKARTSISSVAITWNFGQ
jgi:hypothetical protein